MNRVRVIRISDASPDDQDLKKEDEHSPGRQNPLQAIAIRSETHGLLQNNFPDHFFRRVRVFFIRRPVEILFFFEVCGPVALHILFMPNHVKSTEQIVPAPCPARFVPGLKPFDRITFATPSAYQRPCPFSRMGLHTGIRAKCGGVAMIFFSERSFSLAFRPK